MKKKKNRLQKIVVYLMIFIMLASTLLIGIGMLF
ncbi:stressosome-associated protein Prli42 [Niallia sp. JL1B1071]|uniref:Stressosome-associated protein Prli42 n=2 Tax=Niallia TaxID=2837506 RepID=A0A941GJI3_NIACI|nr:MULTISPECIES: stressosome-associated protein Prli42 [Bacillaceae]MBQ6447148.1 stressosome-associated protein Prli42 [Bacillus sp. (in: firmicutes)]MDU1847401.1 stressosome-associated protein Prli42 [Niallia nealsonii]MBZ9533462.1 stressosome-associated protein Prli42 [Cytobacillus oceanisediminis]MCB5235914.1 stressosome-associated protein Prli42 [Niallia circulans]MED3791336.1 stressosome-associated protein Prli42 [Niallia alba]